MWQWKITWIKEKQKNTNKYFFPDILLNHRDLNGFLNDLDRFLEFKNMNTLKKCLVYY